MTQTVSDHVQFKIEGRRFELPYGRTCLPLDLTEANAEIEVLLPPRPPLAPDTEIVARSAMENPIGTARLRDLARVGEKVAILISDVTRPCPSAKLLPLVLEELATAGVADADILIVSGLGSHRKQTDKERIGLVGEQVFARYRCIDGDPDEVTLVGQTSRGTPVEVFTPVVTADRRVCIGAIEYHYFAGFSGGYKALVPGVCAERTVEANHSWMVQPGAEIARLEGNPVRADIDEGGALVGADFILNVILDDEQRVVAAVAGDPVAAHRAGCDKLVAFGRPELPWYADVVVVSAGGFPKDLNLYQAQKALDNARLAVRQGGTIILVAECAEGLGHGSFAEWMLSGQSPDALIDRIRAKFVLGGHKAAAIAMTRKRATLALVSAFALEQAQAMGFEPYLSVQEALTAALSRNPGTARVAIMPLGGSALPRVLTATAAAGA